MARKIRRRGEGTIRQRPDGVWEARITLPNGKRKSLYAPTEEALLAKLRQAPRAELTIWNPQEADAFLVATWEHPFHALYVLALTTGMRQGELLGLRWGDVDFKAGTLAVRRALQWQRGTGLVFTEPKTPRSR